MEKDILRDEAVKFVNDFTKNEKYISLRIRNGYVGKELDGSGKKLQTERAKPRGTFVAIKGDSGKVYIGGTYLSNKDKDIPIFGIKKALENAISNRENDKNDISLKNNNDKLLYDFFEVRAKCYFYPEDYSHSRGKTPINYPKYDKIHKNRARVLG